MAMADGEGPGNRHPKMTQPATYFLPETKINTMFAS